MASSKAAVADFYPRASIAIEARGVSRLFGDRVAVDDVSLVVRPGELHALLGQNGAGKTTLLRTLSGLLSPTSGSVNVLGTDLLSRPRELRRLIGLVPSGDRTFYLRISGLENLVFFARLHGFRRRAALARASELLEAVGLADAAKVRVGNYSHGMQKRLSVARALLASPPVLLVDEATHDLDPEGARRVRRLVADAAEKRAAVIWTTQRIEEIRGFATGVTLLHRGRVRFEGGVPALMAHASPQRYLVQLQSGSSNNGVAALQFALGGHGSIVPASAGDSGHYLLSLGEGVVLGDALALLAGARFKVVACREEHSEVESAFLELTRDR